MDYLQGMGFNTGTGQQNGRGTMVAPQAGTFNANIDTTGGFKGGVNAEPGVLALIVLTAGLTIFYLSTRKIQGSL